MATERIGGNRFIVSYANRQVANALTVSAGNALSATIKRLGDESPVYMRKLARAIDLKAMPTSVLKDTNMQLAQSAQKAMVAGWRSRLPAKAPGYRPVGVARDPWGRLVGRLGPALDSPAMLQATTANTISFVNGTHMANQAAHWWRVNYGSYGAGGLRGRRPGQFQVMGDGQTLMTLRDRAKPSPGNWLPRKFIAVEASYFSPLPLRPGDARRKEPMKLSKGIRPARFTDLGLKTVAKEFYPAYVNTFDKYVNDAANRARVEKFKISVDARVARARG